MVEVEQLIVCDENNPDGQLRYQLVLPPGEKFADETEANQAAMEMNRVLSTRERIQ